MLSNVGGGALNTRMYGVCLTAYRKETEDEDAIVATGDGDKRGDESGVALWWPVVLFMLSRFAIVPQLQVM